MVYAIFSYLVHAFEGCILMLNKTLSLLSFWLLIIPLALFSQNAEKGTQSGRAFRMYQRALDHYARRDFNQALHFSKRAFKIDSNFAGAYLLAGDLAMELRDDHEAIGYYEQAIEKQPDYHPPAYYILASLYYSTGDYKKAYEHFRHYSNYKLSQDERKLVEKRMQHASAAHDLKNNPVPFNPVNLCFNVNTENDEYVNAISADGKMLIFTVRSPHLQAGSQRQFREKFFVSYLENDEWSAATQMKYLSGTSESEGALALSYDNRFIFFTSCHRPEGFGSCDLYYSVKQGETWSDPENLGPTVNSTRWESQPSLSSDGRTLYFASNRSGGYGGSDIWKTVLRDDGSWSPPENLGEIINTADDEMSPYMHADGQTLYFSSKGHPGLGGADLFMSHRQADETWSRPQNLGYPINTPADEINLIVDPDGLRAYISSDLPQGKGGYDIYMFELHDGIKPLPVSYVKGIVRSANTLRPLAASIELLELERGQTIVESKSDVINGEFLAVLPTGTNYALNVNRKGYLFYSHHFAIDSVTGLFDPVILDIFLKPIEFGQSAILKNVFFAYDSYDLESISRIELNRLVEFLVDNPEIELEISGHTDNVGSRAYNLILSAKRAKAVFDYLISAGIYQKRLSYVGMAEKEPVDTNETPEGRANNRRTEFKIVNHNPY
jgi:Tol biopolymer transport system component